MTGNNDQAAYDAVVPLSFLQAEPASYDEWDIGYEAAHPALQALYAEEARFGTASDVMAFSRAA